MASGPPLAVEAAARHRVAEQSQAALMAAIRAAASGARGQVRVVFAGKPSVGGLDHLVLRLGVDLEDLVRIACAPGIAPDSVPVGVGDAGWPPSFVRRQVRRKR